MSKLKQNFLEIQMREIINKLKEKNGVLVAFSGGVDSSVVTALAHKALGDKALAVTVDSPLLPPGELEDAKKTAQQIGINHVIVKLNELRIPGFTRNPRNRCYLCKKFRIETLKKVAEKRGLQTIVDGTSLSDLDEYRPGLKAVKEEGGYSPLLEAGLRKEDVQLIARGLKLPTADKPPSACLASRIPYGQKLTLKRLRRIAAAEKYIKELVGVKILRVRDHGELARIEVSPDERKSFNNNSMDKIAQRLVELGYKFVTLDLQGYRPGRFDETRRGTTLAD